MCVWVNVLFSLCFWFIKMKWTLWTSQNIFDLCMVSKAQQVPCMEKAGRCSVPPIPFNKHIQIKRVNSFFKIMNGSNFQFTQFIIAVLCTLFFNNICLQHWQLASKYFIFYGFPERSFKTNFLITRHINQLTPGKSGLDFLFLFLHSRDSLCYF